MMEIDLARRRLLRWLCNRRRPDKLIIGAGHHRSDGRGVVVRARRKGRESFVAQKARLMGAKARVDGRPRANTKGTVLGVQHDSGLVQGEGCMKQDNGG